MKGSMEGLGPFYKKCLEGQPPKKGECDRRASKHKSRSVPIESLYRWHMQGWNLAYMHTERPFVDQKKRVHLLSSNINSDILYIPALGASAV